MPRRPRKNSQRTDENEQRDADVRERGDEAERSWFKRGRRKYASSRFPESQQSKMRMIGPFSPLQCAVDPQSKPFAMIFKVNFSLYRS